MATTKQTTKTRKSAAKPAARTAARSGTKGTTSDRIDVRDARVATERYVDHVNRHQVERVLDMCTEDIAVTWLPLGTFDGKIACRQQFEELFRAFPDFHRDGEIIAVDGDCVVSEFTVSGTFTGAPFAGLAPTGQKAHVRVMEAIRFRGDRIQRINTYWDGMEMARELGALPNEGSVADRVMRNATNIATRARRITRRS